MIWEDYEKMGHNNNTHNKYTESKVPCHACAKKRLCGTLAKKPVISTLCGNMGKTSWHSYGTDKTELYGTIWNNAEQKCGFRCASFTARKYPKSSGKNDFGYFHFEKVFGGATRTRTGGKGFAVLCLTTWLWRHITFAALWPQMYFVERATRLELATSTLARWRSTG